MQPNLNFIDGIPVGEIYTQEEIINRQEKILEAFNIHLIDALLKKFDHIK